MLLTEVQSGYTCTLLEYFSAPVTLNFHLIDILSYWLLQITCCISNMFKSIYFIGNQIKKYKYQIQ